MVCKQKEQKDMKICIGHRVMAWISNVVDYLMAIYSKAFVGESLYDKYISLQNKQSEWLYDSNTYTVEGFKTQILWKYTFLCASPHIHTQL